jgi:hypothetical protein
MKEGTHSHADCKGFIKRRKEGRKEGRNFSEVECIDIQSWDMRTVKIRVQKWENPTRNFI